MKTIQFLADGLGDASYLVVGETSAAVVDPQRDVRPLAAAAREHGVPIEFVFETHVHNDYISGGRELAAQGARVVAPANSGLEFPHIALSDGQSLSFGGVTLAALAAPGHTFEHTAYLASAERQNVAAFTGGSLLMATVGRSDLLGPDAAEQLTRLQWESAMRLRATVTPSTQIYPTHGAGSFCSSAGADAGHAGPMSEELVRNTVYATAGYEAFRAIQLSSLAPIPRYYRYIAPINREGPRVYGTPPRPARLSPADVAELLREGVDVIDARPRRAFAAAHVPGSVLIEGDGSFLAYTGWLTPFNGRLALITEDSADAERLTVDLFRIGYENVAGFMTWADWTAEGRPAESMQTTNAAGARDLLRTGEIPVYDVRFDYEQDETPVEGASRRPIDQLPGWIGAVERRPHLLFCASGQRAAMAGSFLQRAGHTPVVLIAGGADDLRG